MANNRITITKGGATKKVTEQIWKLMPKHKYGWKIQDAELPEEIKALTSGKGGKGKGGKDTSKKETK